jgi:hypothetical protein
LVLWFRLGHFADRTVLFFGIDQVALTVSFVALDTQRWAIKLGVVEEHGRLHEVKDVK